MTFEFGRSISVLSSSLYLQYHLRNLVLVLDLPTLGRKCPIEAKSRAVRISAALEKRSPGFVTQFTTNYIFVDTNFPLMRTRLIRACCPS